MKKRFKIIVTKIENYNLEDMFRNMRLNRNYCEFDTLSMEGNPSLGFIEQLKFSQDSKYIIGFGGCQFFVLALKGPNNCPSSILTVDDTIYERILDLNIVDKDGDRSLLIACKVLDKNQVHAFDYFNTLSVVRNPMIKILFGIPNNASFTEES